MDSNAINGLEFEEQHRMGSSSQAIYRSCVWNRNQIARRDGQGREGEPCYVRIFPLGSNNKREVLGGGRVTMFELYHGDTSDVCDRLVPVSYTHLTLPTKA